MRRLVPLVLMVATLVLLASSASAQDGSFLDETEGNPTGPGDYVPPPPDASVTFRLAYRDSMRVVAERGGIAGATAECGNFDVIASNPSADAFEHNFDIVTATSFIDGEWYLLHCWEPGGNPWVDGIPPYPIGFQCCNEPTPGGTLVNTWDIAAYAVGNIDFFAPTPEVSPTGEQVVGVPTWLAVTSQLEYAPVTAAAGPLWATATPVFREAVWEFGNGDEPVTCDGDDVATLWNAEIDAAEQSTGCDYVYESNGDGEAFEGAVTLYWDVYWEESRNPGVQQYFQELALTTPVVFNVRELQAVID